MNSYNFSQALNQEFMNTHYSEDLGFCKTLLELFGKQIPPEIIAINTAVAEKDYTSLRALAHKVRPSFEMVGLSEISSSIQELELKAKSEDETAFEIFRLINPKIEEGLEIIDQELNRLKTYISSL